MQFGDKHERKSIYSQPMSGRVHASAVKGVGATAVPTPAPGSTQKMQVTEPQRYPDVSLISASVGVTSNQVLTAAATTRVLLIIQNISNNPVWVNFGADASTTQGLLLGAGITASNTPGGSVTFDSVVPQGDVYMLSTVAASTVIIIYANKQF